jgi:thiamine biosynthesis protein ThiS
MSVTLLVNGERRAVQPNLPLSELIAQCGFDVKAPLVVSVNDEHIPRPTLASTCAYEGDRIEVLTVRQGG